MPFTHQDRERLQAARSTVAHLQVKEQMALNDVSRVLFDSGLELRDGFTWEDIAGNADAIRDALQPFDSGVREGKT